MISDISCTERYSHNSPFKLSNTSNVAVIYAWMFISHPTSAIKDCVDKNESKFFDLFTITTVSPWSQCFHHDHHEVNVFVKPRILFFAVMVFSSCPWRRLFNIFKCLNRSRRKAGFKRNSGSQMNSEFSRRSITLISTLKCEVLTPVSTLEARFLVVVFTTGNNHCMVK